MEALRTVSCSFAQVVGKSIPKRARGKKSFASARNAGAMEALFLVSWVIVPVHVGTSERIDSAERVSDNQPIDTL